MQDQQFILQNSAQIILGAVFGAIALVMVIESLAPWRRVQDAPLARWTSNLGLTALDYVLLFALGPYLALYASQAMGWPQMGFLGRFGGGPVTSFILLMLVMELLNYWLHRAFHRIPVLWRIHAVHHSDVEMDATTSHRHHPLEMVINSGVIIPVLILLGPDPWTLLVYNITRITLATLTHGNFSLAPALDRVLRLFVVTPDFHRLHHSAERRYTDSNYSAILPCFDYLFRTATDRPREEHRTMTMGLERFQEPRFSRLDQLLWLPFSSAFRRIP